MSLQTKFIILLTALAGAVLLALGTAWWSLDVTYREVREPVRSSSRVLDLLVKIEKSIDELRGLAQPSSQAFRGNKQSGAQPDAPLQEKFDSGSYLTRARTISALFEELHREDSWAGYAGRSAIRNLRSKMDQLRRTVAAYLSDPSLASPLSPHGDPAAPAGPGPLRVDDPTIDTISNQLFDIHELLKRVEGRIVEDIRDLADSSTDLRSRLVVTLCFALAMVALMGGLAVLLVRRWVVRPVGRLRTAAARIASGDFEHRVLIPDKAPADEMTALSTEVNHMAGMVKQMQTERIEQERLAAIGELMRRLAHNLRNPLAGIRGLAELTRDDVSHLGPAASEVRENQDRIITAVDRFEMWLSDLLNVTKPTQIEPSERNVSQWLSGLVDAHRPLAQSRGVQLDLDLEHGPKTASFDARHLEHAVSAILSNGLEAAAQYRTHYRQPSVRVSSMLRESATNATQWELRIEDTGSGVPQNMRVTIFKPYFTTKADGNGIGLAVAQQVVRAHRGEIRVEDSQTEVLAAAGPVQNGQSPSTSGAAFVIRLPLATPVDEGVATNLATIGQQGASVGPDSGH